ncbi:MAG: phosphoserine phosphatase RsbU/P [Solirubrobacteraceae bacterium]|nr:phosphoserine phosphatase RsbU/P [Solirubrobacteraceae bacterium]
MTPDDGLLEETAEDLFENAPCGYLTCAVDGTILRVNRTFERLTGHDRAALLGRRFRDLLAPAGRIYHETHYVPLLQMQGAVREIALDIVRADGTRLPALVNAVQQRDEAGAPRLVRTTVFDATDRRAYEQELLRARRREQDIAQQLQRSLLSGALAASAALAVDVVYRPAQAGLEVGGDWYDAFWLDAEQRTAALVVGDVVGRGIGAAAAMGQLRSAIRALASTGLAPGPLLDALDGFVARHRVGRMTTVAYAQLHVASGRLRYACAGHPPPILLSPGAAPRYLWDGRSVPLDSVAIDGPRREGDDRLAPGGTLLLYTDGLVERRSQSLDVGFELLLAHAAHHDGDDLAAMLHSVVQAMDDDHTDDLCLLGVRHTG